MDAIASCGNVVSIFVYDLLQAIAKHRKSPNSLAVPGQENRVQTLEEKTCDENSAQLGASGSKEHNVATRPSKPRSRTTRRERNDNSGDGKKGASSERGTSILCSDSCTSFISFFMF